jgi:hypothetical protein
MRSAMSVTRSFGLCSHSMRCAECAVECLRNAAPPARSRKATGRETGWMRGFMRGAGPAAQRRVAGTRPQPGPSLGTCQACRLYLAARTGSTLGMPCPSLAGVVTASDNRRGRLVADAPDVEPFMTTPRDLLIVTMDMASGSPPERGDLSLALAGAEAIDLLGAQAIRLDGDHIVPSNGQAIADRLLDEAASLLARQAPYESVGDWLWRRGRDLFSSYLAALEAEGQVTRQHLRWRLFRTGRTVLVDSPARREGRQALDFGRCHSRGTCFGGRHSPQADGGPPGHRRRRGGASAGRGQCRGDGTGLVRQRPAIEEAALDNIWRGD